MSQAQQVATRKASHYERYFAAPFNQPDHYPLHQSLPDHYRPIAEWMGRLILPQCDERSALEGGVYFEVHHTPASYSHRIGQTVQLRWIDDPELQRRLSAVTRDVKLDEQAIASIQGGRVHPERLDGWKQVTPLESLAGAHPHDDVFVSLPTPVHIEEVDGAIVLRIEREPVRISGRYYALATFLGPEQTESDRYRIAHYDRKTKTFAGPEEIVRLPTVVADDNTMLNSTVTGIERSSPNAIGWYIYGAHDESGLFVVQALAPRALVRLQPEQILFGEQAAWHYNRHGVWEDAVKKKGTVASVLCSARQDSDRAAALAEWREGDQALLLHVYGGVGGKKREPSAIMGLFWGHFAFGVATVVREPLADELSFAINYHQIYTQNTDGIISGTVGWMHYMGDRQFGWAGTRPVCDILLKLDSYTEPYDFLSGRGSGLSATLRMLELMAARYRIGDGTGGTYVTPANNCAQDANQSLYATIYYVGRLLRERPEFETWRQRNPEDAKRLDRLRILGRSLNKALMPFGKPRTDWYPNLESLASNLDRNAVQNLWSALGSWRTMLPRLASDTILRVFLKNGASAWFLSTYQIGGNDPDIEPIATFP